MGPPPMNGWGILPPSSDPSTLDPFRRGELPSLALFIRAANPDLHVLPHFFSVHVTRASKSPFSSGSKEKNRLQHRGNVRSSNAEAPFSWPFDHRAYGTWLLSFFLRAGGSQTSDKRPTPPPPPPPFFQGKEATDLFYAPASYVEGKEEKH